MKKKKKGNKSEPLFGRFYSCFFFCVHDIMLYLLILRGKTVSRINVNLFHLPTAQSTASNLCSKKGSCIHIRSFDQRKCGPSIVVLFSICRFSSFMFRSIYLLLLHVKMF